MKKIIYLFLLSLGVIACSVESTDSSENLLTADAKATITVETASVDIPEEVCAGVGANYCVNFSQATKGNGDPKTSEVQVQLYDDVLEQYIQIAQGKENTYLCFDYTLDTPGVYNLRYQVAGIGGGFTDFTVSVNNCNDVCTHGFGWWKNHSNDNPGNQDNLWPVSELVLGSVTYSQDQINDIMNQPVQGNGLVSLTHHLAAAKLNIANGVDDTSVTTVITSADALIGSLVVPPVGTDELSTSEVGELKDALDTFNNSIPCEEDLY